MKIWILIFSAALFAGGTCLGVALQPKIAPPQPIPPKAVPDMPWESHRSPQFSVTRFASDLKLTDEQDRELDAILSDSQEEMQALGRVMHAAHEKSRERIVAILTPEQKTQLDSLIGKSPWAMLNEMSERNMELWKTMQEGFLSAAAGRTPPAKPGTKK